MVDIILRCAVYKGTKLLKLQDIPTTKAPCCNSEANKYKEPNIDPNEHFIKNKPATYFFHMQSNAMIDAGIHPGDILVVIAA